MRLLEKIIPKQVYRLGQPLYHFILAFLGSLFYGAPSRKMFVIGVTGTKGKTTTSYLIYQILNAVGLKTGMTTSVFFGDGGNLWRNDTKHAMPGRFKLQKLLAQMVKAGCKYAVIETSSEGILQFRHRFIDYQAAIFTNLSPEHIERHGGFEKYCEVKLKLFEKIVREKNGTGVYNLDDPNADRFLKPKIAKKIGYTINSKLRFENKSFQKIIAVQEVKPSLKGSTFEIDGVKFTSPLVGEFNVYNAAAAIAFAFSQNIPLAKIKEALATAKSLPGRLEIVEKGQNFTVIVDYAHEPASLEAVYKTAKLFKPKKIIALLGSQGGGRDKWKRAAMAKIAEKYCDEIIFTNEDPYDESPSAILDDMEKGLSQIPNSPSAIGFASNEWRAGKSQTSKNYWKIVDRKEAIQKAISLAKKGDTVILTGKGGEVWMCVQGGKKIPWDERAIIEEALKQNIRSYNYT